MTPKSDIKEVLSTDEDFFLDDFDSETGAIIDEEVVGQLAIDMYQTAKDIVIKAPVAGVSSDKIDILITDELVSIKGTREEQKESTEDRYYTQECYWGTFARTISLPTLVVPDKADASFKDGILTIRAPKARQSKMRKLKVNK